MEENGLEQSIDEYIRTLGPDRSSDGGPDGNSSTRISEAGRKGRSSEEDEIPILLKPDKPTRTKKKKASEVLTEEDVTIGLFVLFGLIASIRGEHWRKDASELETVAAPIATYLASLPANRSKVLARWILPIQIILASTFILSDPIKVELQLAKERKEKKEGKNNAKQVSGNSSEETAIQEWGGQPTPEFRISSVTQGGHDSIELFGQ